MLMFYRLYSVYGCLAKDSFEFSKLYFVHAHFDALALSMRATHATYFHSLCFYF